MTKYEVVWHDAEDGVGGASFYVEGKNLSDAYDSAAKHIIGLSRVLESRFHSSDIECLIDEEGKMCYRDGKIILR